MRYPVVLAVLAHVTIGFGHDRADLPGVTAATTLPANDAAYRLRLVPAGDSLWPSTNPFARRRDRVLPSAPKLYEEYHPYGTNTATHPGANLPGRRRPPDPTARKLTGEDLLAILEAEARRDEPQRGGR